MKKLKDIRQNAVNELVKIDISRNEASAEVDIIINDVFGLSKKDILSDPDRQLDELKIKKFDNLIRKRITDRIPVQYLTNKAYFMGQEFYVDENVLIPRPETEILVEKVIEIAKTYYKSDYEFNIIDVGTGSGCIACMLAMHLENAEITAVDISEKALEVAKHNARRLNVESKINFQLSNILVNVDKTFDIIVSNPPYISCKEKTTLQPEVTMHEPDLALFVEDSEGISFYQQLIAQAKSKLMPEGFLAVEIGISQAEKLKHILNDYNFTNIQIIKDFNYIDRVILAKNR